MNEFKENKGITLIALVITIIILLILAGVTIAMLTGENGLLKKALKAKEETEIQGYYEKIEMIRSELRLNNPNYEPPTLQQMQEEFKINQQSWVKRAEIKKPEEVYEKVETLELQTNEGYIFHINTNGTSYVGKDKVRDMSALEKLDALELEEVGPGKNGGKLVKITDKSEKDYYEIEYQIGSTEGKWTKIKSGETVDVGPSQTIHARLTFEINKGVIVSLSIAATEPQIIVKEEIDTSNYVRKTPNELAKLFQITWGSDGQGEIEYQVTGKLKYKERPFQISFNSKDAETIGLGDLELGDYTITCTVTAPSTKTATATKQNIAVTNLATTGVTNESNNSVNAYAIYSEYDLAYFRDLVNVEKQFTINGKLMDNINLSKVCSSQEGSWTPIGEYNSTSPTTIEEASSYYDGIFDGNGKKIENLYIDNQNLYRQGLFSIAKSNAVIKNVKIYGNINTKQAAARNLWMVNRRKSNGLYKLC